MLQPKTIGALVFLAVAGGAAYWQVTREDEHLEREAPPSPLPEFAVDDVDELAIADPKTQVTVVLKQTGDGWTIAEPLADEADDRHVTAAIEQLAGARVVARPAATSQASWPKLKVGEDEAVTVTLRGGGAELATIHLSLDGNYLRIGDGEAVHQVHGINRAMLAREVRMWRNRNLVSFDPATVKTVAATAADGARAAAERTPAAGEGGTDSWTLTAGEQIVGRLDDTVPAGIVSRMQTLGAQDFADDQTLEGAGLAEPRLTITVTTDDGTEHALLVGDAADDKRTYIGKPGSDRVWVTSTATLESFARPPLQWRDKTIATLEPADVARLDVRHEGARLVAERGTDGTWSVTQPNGIEPATDRLEQLAGAMRNLRGAKIAGDVSRKAAGFAQPTAVATFSTRDRSAVTVTVGAKTEDGTLWHVRASTRDDTLLVADYLVKRLLVTPKDVTKAAE